MRNGKYELLKMKSSLLMVFCLMVVSCGIYKHSTSVTNIVDADNMTLINDSCDAIMFDGKSVDVYKSLSLIRDSLAFGSDSILGYPVEKKSISLNESEKAIVRFLLTDSVSMTSSYEPIRQPFNPNVIVKFKKNKELAYALISFGSGEIAFANRSQIVKFYALRNMHEYERWYNMIVNKK